MAHRGADESETGSEAMEMVWPLPQLQRGVGRKVKTTGEKQYEKWSFANWNKHYQKEDGQ